MVSRETEVHVVAVTLALAMLAAVGYFAPDFDDPVYLAGLLPYNALIIGGAHFYLAWRGEEGTVPVSSRWRFLLALAAVVGLPAVAAFWPDVGSGE